MATDNWAIEEEDPGAWKEAVSYAVLELAVVNYVVVMYICSIVLGLIHEPI